MKLIINAVKISINLIFIVLNVENMVCEEQHFVDVWDEITLFQTANKTSHRNVVYKYNHCNTTVLSNPATTCIPKCGSIY